MPSPVEAIFVLVCVHSSTIAAEMQLACASLATQHEAHLEQVAKYCSACRDKMKHTLSKLPGCGSPWKNPISSSCVRNASWPVATSLLISSDGNPVSFTPVTHSITSTRLQHDSTDEEDELINMMGLLQLRLVATSLHICNTGSPNSYR